MSDPRSKIQVFDPKQEYSVLQRRLPHWSQAGTLAFITWRTWDSIPEDVLEQWLSDRNAWLAAQGIDVRRPNWKAEVASLSPARRLEYDQFSVRWNDHLDECHGACVLRRPELAAEVAKSLRHFDGQRYELTDFVVMPNHVHLIAAFPDEQGMVAQCDSWKHFTAVQINRALGRKGRFWQEDGFDHLIRSLEQFERFRRYIAQNPEKARLRPGEYLHESRIL